MEPSMIKRPTTQTSVPVTRPAARIRTTVVSLLTAGAALFSIAGHAQSSGYSLTALKAPLIAGINPVITSVAAFDGHGNAYVNVKDPNAQPATDPTADNQSIFAFVIGQGEPRQLHNLPGASPVGIGVQVSGANSIGQAVGGNVSGILGGGSFSTTGIYWKTDATPISLGSAAIGDSSAAAVNDAGVVVGSAKQADDSTSNAVMWTNVEQHPTVTILGRLQGDRLASANAISSNNLVAGVSFSRGAPVQHAFLWRAGQMTDLGNLDERCPIAGAVGVNSKGIVVGTANVLASDGVQCVIHGFSWLNGHMTDLGTLPGGQESFPNAINEDGVIVGNSDANDTRGAHAVLWRSGQIVDLQSLFAAQLPSNVVLHNATAISKDGRIALAGTDTTTGASVFYVASPLTTIATRTTLTSSAVDAFFGQPVTFTATVTPDSGATPTGSVTFTVDGKILGPAKLSSSAGAQLTTSTLTYGAHKVVATYEGAGADAASTSRTLSQNIWASFTKTVLTSSANPAKLGAPFTLIATVTSSFGDVAGTVIFKYGSSTIGTVPLSGASGTTKQATLSVTKTITGSFPFTASFAGKINFLASSGSLTEKVQ